MKRFVSLLSTLILLLVAEPGRAGLFLQIDDVLGTSTQKDHKDWIEVSAFSIGVTKPDIAEAQFTPLAITATPSPASVEIFEGVVSGETFQEVRLDITQPVGSGAVETIAYWKIEQARITSYSTSVQPDGEGGTVATEQYDITPIGRISYVFNSFDETGNKTGSIDSTWNIAQGTKSTSQITGTVTDFQFLTDDSGICDDLSINHADFDNDGDVDHDDLNRWQTSFGVDAEADADGDGDSDGGDFLAWQRQFRSNTSLTSAATIPEPSSWLLLISASYLVFMGRRSRS